MTFIIMIIVLLLISLLSVPFGGDSRSLSDPERGPRRGIV